MKKLNIKSTTHNQWLSMKTLMLFISLFFLGGCSFNTKDATPFNDIRNPRFSPNSKQIVFDIVNASFPERGRIYLYDLETKQLSTYIAPHGQCFEMASFSDDGKKLVFITSPVGDRNSSIYKQRNEILLDYQIATMNVDGSDMQVLTSEKSLKIFPAFSHKSDKIIYAKAETIRDKGATPAAFYNPWELNLKSGQSTLFLGKRFSFYKMGYSTYFNDDETVLMAAYGPSSENLPIGMDFREFSKETNHSQVYKVKRGQTELGMPILMEFSFSTKATMDMDENIYFYADEKKEGLKIRKFETNGKFSKWSLPTIKGSANTNGMSVSKDGDKVVYCFTYDNSQLMLLDTHTGIWSEIILPQTAKEIQVQ